ncbi:hypothetical protein [Lentisalinibacter salinarum]|uniref:hypothetical protein n=1 Tax=Lentisalinibacter salinarum TaxID=2992239 RepID=UPI00386B930E
MIPWAVIDASRPPDEDAGDMVERAFLGYQIDALAYRLALVWLDQYGVLRDR